MAFQISGQTRKILLDALDLERLIEVMDRDYAGLDEEHDVDRGKAMRYAGRNRGDLRIATGRFYTIREHLERIVRVRRLRLP